MLRRPATDWTRSSFLELGTPCSFILAIAGAAKRPCIAAAIVLSDEGRPRIIIQYFDLDRKIEAQLITLATMDSVNLCIDDDGSVVAVSQANHLYICKIDGSVEQINCSGAIEQLGFFRGHVLIVKHSSQVFTWSPRQPQPLLVERHVREVAIGNQVVIMRHSGEVELVHMEEGAPTSFQRIPGLHIPAGARVALHQDRSGLLISAEGKLGRDGARPFVLYRTDFEGRQPKRLFEGLLSDFIGKERTCKVLSWEECSAIAVAERADYSRLWVFKEGESPLPISPPDVEVMYADATVEQRAIVFIGSDISNPSLSTCRNLMIAVEDDQEWRTQSIAEGSFLLPKWFNGQWLAYGSSNGEDCLWRLSVRVPPISPSPAIEQRARKSDTVLRADSVSYTLVQANRISRPQFAVLYVPGPHRQLTEGGQDSFFHQWLWSSAMRLVDESTICLAINPPGSLGLGASVRKCGRPLVEESKEAVLSALDNLWRAGVTRVGIVCGSLGALPVLACLDQIRQSCACCFVAAVLDPAHALSDPWLSIVAGNEIKRPPRANTGTSLLLI